MRQLEFSFLNEIKSLQALFHSLFIYKKGKLLYRFAPKCLGGLRSQNVEAGFILSGYKKVNLKNKSYMVHHIVFVMHYGDVVFEKLKNGLVVDHIDGNKLNNKIQNLRLCTRSENAKNSRGKRKRTLPKGVYKSRHKGFVAIISAEKKRLEKTFLSIDEAVSWRNWMGKKIHGEFFRGG
jgi:hypothetical protein